MHTVRLNNVKFSLPENYNELTAWQVPLLLRCKYLLPEQTPPEHRQYVFLASVVPSAALMLIRRLDAYQLSLLLPLVGWITDPLPPVPLIKVFEHKGVRYLSPDAMMRNSVIAEYANCDRLLSEHENNPDYIEKITAYLYRPEDPKRAKEQDRREVMNTSATHVSAEQFATLPEHIKLGAVFFFLAVKEYIARQYAVAFEPDGENPLPPSWAMSMMSVAESGVFGTLNDVKYTNMHEYFTLLVKKKLEARHAQSTQRT